MVDFDFFFNILFFTISSFEVKLLALELCNFFTFLSVRLSRVRVSQINPG
jgi:hypothetical protein